METYAGVMEVQEDDGDELEGQETASSISTGTRKRMNYVR